MKLSQLYNREAFQVFADSVNKTKFYDASGVLLARSLTKVDPTLIETKYPENVFLNSGFDISNIGGYANAVQTLRVSGAGEFKTANGSTNSQGIISLQGEDSTIKVTERAATTVWTDTEVQQAAMEGYNIASRYVMEVDRIYKQDLDRSGLVGLETGQYGILNSPSFTAAALSAAIGAGTALEDYELVSGFIIAQHNAVNNTPEYMANKLFMPATVLNHLAKTILNSASGDKSILMSLKANFPSVDFIATARAQSVGGGRVMSIVASNPNVLKFRLPVPLKNAPLETNGFRKSTDYVYRIAGVDVLEAAGGRIATGV